MEAWDAEPLPELPAPSVPGRVRGSLRLAGLLVLTGLALGLFLVGRFLRGVLGRWVTFHFEVARLWARGVPVPPGLRGLDGGWAGAPRGRRRRGRTPDAAR